ncbi:MAG: peptidylprolyl isomerase [Acidimicrobiales bacterium]|nr:peptidylprolyl isomerase [Acidimicrobiales bacterium]
MGTEKRERKKAGRQSRLEAERAAATRSRRLKGLRNLVVFLILLAILLYALSGCSSSKSTSVKAAVTAPAAGAAATCPPATGAPRTIDLTAAPLSCLDKGKRYTAIVTTSEGQVTVALDTTRTPKTTSNFVALSRWKFYDGTALFRTERASGIIQGGSPHTQDNSDPGPGYTIPDEGGRFTSADYAPGVLAMGRTAEANSGSAQFFFLANEGGRYLGDPAGAGQGAGTYVVFGKATKGLDVLQKIAALDDGSGAPTKPAKIVSIRIVES